MVNTILGTKLHMMQAFTKTGIRLPVTVVKSGQNIVIQVKELEKDGYHSIQLGFGSRKEKNTPKPLQGHFKKAIKDLKQKEFPRYLKEVRLEDEPEVQAGDTIFPSEVFKPGDLVEVVGVSKGKGFAGVVKRHHFAGGPKTHGQSDRQRAPGSIGQATTPGRVYKGKRMAGRMGYGRVTVKNLTVCGVDPKTGEIQLSGPVPGSRGSLLIITKVGENKRAKEWFEQDAKEVDENGSKTA